MSKRKFRFLVGFLIFSILFVSAFVATEVLHLNPVTDALEAKEIVKPVTEVSVDATKAAGEITTDTKTLSVKKPLEQEKALPGDTTLVFAGDVLLTDSHISRYLKGKKSITQLLGSSLLREFKNADYAMINEEFPFGTGGIKAKDKQYTFQVHPDHVGILKKMGIDGVTLANNHILDFGKGLLLETLSTLDQSEIAHIGAGKNLEQAKEPILFTNEGIRFAIIGASRVIPEVSWNASKSKPGVFTTYDPAPMVSQIRALKSKNDVVIAYVHWGIERKTRPEKYQRLMAQQYIDAGADVVIGSHPHVLQGMEYYKGKPIIYSLGNFMFNTKTYDTALLKLTVDADKQVKAQMIPCQSSQGKVIIKPKKDWEKHRSMFQNISYNCIIMKDGTFVEDK